jgi:hypothetical protein
MTSKKTPQASKSKCKFKIVYLGKTDGYGNFSYPNLKLQFSVYRTVAEERLYRRCSFHRLWCATEGFERTTAKSH